MIKLRLLQTTQLARPPLKSIFFDVDDEISMGFLSVVK